MKPTLIRRYRRSSTPTKSESNFFKKESQETFFGEPSHETFFQPSPNVQRKCDECEKEDKKVHRLEDKKEEDKKVMRAEEKKEEEKIQRAPEKKEEEKVQRAEDKKEEEKVMKMEDKKEEEKVQKKESGSSSSPGGKVSNYIGSLNGKGQALPPQTNHFFSSRMGYDFSGVKIHNDKAAAESATDINARAYTVGNNIVFNEGEYNTESGEGKRLMAHELTHVVQQDNSDTGKVQRAVKFNILDWDAMALASPALTNTPASIDMATTPQVQVSALVEVNGNASDPCNDYEFGTTQTAWISWVRIDYQGRTPADGSVVIKYKPSMPMRDPADPAGIWYQSSLVKSPASCGDSVSIIQSDAPMQSILKTQNNSAVAGSPVNYLRNYTRGLHVVTYLAGKRKSGSYLAQPLKFRYWNSIQNFAFTPNYASPASSWASTGGVKVNIGSQGSGETTDAPYYTTSGTTYNDHFNNMANWIANPQP